MGSSFLTCVLVSCSAMTTNQTDADAGKFLRDYAQTRGFMLGRPTRPTPTPDGKSVLFLRSAPRVAKLSLFEFDVATGQTRELLTPQQLLKGAEENLSPEEKARRERMRVSVGGFTGFQLSGNGNLILLGLSEHLYIFDRAAGSSTELKTGPGPLLDPQFSPDGTRISYVRNNDVFVLDLASQKEQQVTTGGTDLVSHGLAEFVAQEEMGRFSGYWWSPDSRHIAYEESNAKGVEIWHVADPLHPEQTPTPFFYPRPGKANVKVRLGVVTAHGGPTTWIDWDSAKYPYLAGVHWPHDGPLMLSVQNREQTELLVLEANQTAGTTAPLLTERDPAWVNLHQEFPYWLGSAQGFLWLSERDGGPQLELRTRQGRLRQVLVPASQGFQNLVAVDTSSQQIIYNASVDPTQSHVFRIEMKEGSEPVQLTKERGLHSAVFGPKLSMHVRSSRLFSAMPRTTVRRGDGTLIGELPSVAEPAPFTPRVDLLQVGKESFHAAIVWPREFDPKKRYPVLLDVYGGPHHKHVVAAMNRWVLDQWYADQGFIVVAIDGRGTPGRGRDWERAIKYKFGSLPLDDQVAGLKALGDRYPVMDMKRVGIDGWSFGGYLAGLAVLRRPDVFHAAVAGAPVTDWYDYDTHYTERYLGVPELKPAKDAPPTAANLAYKEGSLLTYAPQMKRPLLLLHGTADDNVYFRHSLKLADALFRNGKDFEILPLSGLTHMVPNPIVMENLHARIVRFLHKHLGLPSSVGMP